MLEFKIRFCTTKTPDGLYHVQNYVGGYRGQHHVHNEKSFNSWKKNIDETSITIMTGTCDCDMTSGDVKEYNGHRWYNDRFE